VLPKEPSEAGRLVVGVMLAQVDGDQEGLDFLLRDVSRDDLVGVIHGLAVLAAEAWGEQSESQAALRDGLAEYARLIAVDGPG
jgi:hypothetical protein